jgi:hypothetical protein
MSGGRDTSVILKLFRTACISYQPSAVQYRDYSISRTSMIAMRQSLHEKILFLMQKSPLFIDAGEHPHKYFNELVI